MYSSPLTPSGTALILLSSTYASVLAIARPIPTVSAPSSTSSTSSYVLKVVASVGPYTCSSRSGFPLSTASLTRLTSTASPPNSTCLIPLKAVASSLITSLNNAVVINSVLTPLSFSALPNSLPDSATSLLIITSLAPLKSAPHISNVIASNDALDSCATRSSLVSLT